MYGKLPTFLLLSFALFWLSPICVNGQSPFTGGSSGGEAGVRLTVSPCVANTANPYAGGIGSTNFYDSLINSVCAPAAADPYSGGPADGFAEASIIVSVCYPTILNPFSGGYADGFSENSLINSTCASVIINPYSGGYADGFSEAALINSTCVSVIVDPFSGGPADGFAENAQIVSLCASIFIDPFSGGFADGYSDASFIQSICFPEMLSIFSGGNSDGFTDAVLSASLGFNIPPPATTSVCENSQAYIGLEEGDPSLTYQWELSTNGGTVFNPVSNGGAYAGATDDTLWINPVTNSYNGYVYRVLVSYPGCASGYSPNSTIGVGMQPVSPTILKNPNVGHVCPGTDVAAAFAAGTGGAGAVSDSFEYTTNGGSIWSPYIASSVIPTASLQGTEVVKIRTWRTATGQGCITPTVNTAAWTVAGVGYWVGVTSPDWNTASNWGCAVIPDTTIDVIIPEVQIGNNQPNIFNAPNAYAHDLTIEPNASVTTYYSFNLELHGDFINNGISSLGIGKVTFAGHQPQYITGTTPSDFSYVEVDNNSAPSTALLLDQDITVSDELKITNGMVDLNAHDIDLGSTGMLTGETETSRITGSSGKVKSLINMSSLATTYNNIHGLGIDLTTGATAVPGFSEVNRGHFTYTLQPAKTAIERYFEIVPSVNDELDVTMKMHYFDAELVSGGHVEAELIPWRSEDQGVTWVGQSELALLSRDITENWVQKTGINAFSHWTLGEGGGALPVELMEFTAWPDGDIVRLKWSTAMEIDNDYFTVERSNDGVHFSDIITVDGAGNSTTMLTYKSIDHEPLPGVSYYRLRQTDFDGDEAHSNIVAVSFRGSYQQAFSAFVGENQNFNVLYKGKAGEHLDITVFDAIGRRVITKSTNAVAGENKILIENRGLAAGVYMLELKADDFQESKKLFVR